MGKKRSARKRQPPNTAQHPPTPPGGDAVEMVLVPSGFAWTSPEQPDFQLIATQGPATTVAGPEMAVAARGSGVGLPVFTLVPRHSYDGKVSADDVPPADERRTRAYGGHDLILSGSMSDAMHGPPAFMLTPAAPPKNRRLAKSHPETKRQK